MKNAWVTGAGGFLGRHVAGFFAERGYKVAGLDISPWEPEEHSNWGMTTWVTGTVSADSLNAMLEATDPPDVVFHAAGSGSVGHSFENSLQDFDRNVASTARILDFLRQCAPKAYFLLPSSAAVYGSQPLGPIHEDVPACPVSPYGFHKAMAEMLCRSAVDNFNLSCAVIRYFSLYGPELRKQLLWDVAGRLLNKPEELILFGTGDETRDMLYVEDAARLAYVVADNSKKGLQVVNGGTGDASSVRRIAELMIEYFRVPSKLRFNQEVRSGDPRHYQADTEAARGLGFQPVWSLQDGIQEFVKWFQRQHVEHESPAANHGDGKYV